MKTWAIRCSLHVISRYVNKIEYEKYLISNIFLLFFMKFYIVSNYFYFKKITFRILSFY